MERFFEISYVVLLVGYYFIYAPHMRAVKRERVVDDRKAGLEFGFSMLAFVGMQILPLVYVFSRWLRFADYELPAAFGFVGILLFAGSLVIHWKSHADLGRNWSPTVQIKEGQGLVTQGIYAWVRHPIYLGQWMWAIAQPLLLHNWIAGLAGIVTFGAIFFYRRPREERMMLDHFGDEYRRYMARVGGTLPRLRRG
jgi:protein-S-isoprenylcysteine O-methyltransferase Ste14